MRVSNQNTASDHVPTMTTMIGPALDINFVILLLSTPSPSYPFVIHDSKGKKV